MGFTSFGFSLFALSRSEPYDGADTTTLLQHVAAAQRATHTNDEECSGPNVDSLQDPEPLRSKDHACSKGLFADLPDGSMRSYNLVLTEADLELLNNDPIAEMYVPCDVVIDYVSATSSIIRGAECRYKGSAGSFLGCLESLSPLGGPKENSSNFLCRKLSWKVKLKGAENKDAGMGLKKFQILGAPHDGSVARVRLAAAILNDAGIVAPCAVPANLYVNGKYEGVHDFVEEIDDAFTKSRFSDDTKNGEGALYKETWPVNSDPDWYENPTNPFSVSAAFELKEEVKGEDYNYLFAGLFEEAEGFVKGCKTKRCTSKAAGKILDRYVDAQSYIDGFVGIVMTANWDQVFSLMHNYYVYVKNEKLFYLSWDFNEVLNGPLPAFDNFVTSLQGSPLAGAAKGIFPPFPWYHVLSEDERKWACVQKFSPIMGHFTCDPVAELMARAWKKRFFKTFKKLRKGAVKKARRHLERWTSQTESAVRCGAANGDWPPVETFEKETPKLIPRFESALQLWKAMAKGAEWPITCSIDPSTYSDACTQADVAGCSYRNCSKATEKFNFESGRFLVGAIS